MLNFIKKFGWWNGKWQAPKIYEGDELELKRDGTFTSSGALNINDGSIWLNVANGKLNLKRDHAGGAEEGLTKDYKVISKNDNSAIIDVEDSTSDYYLKRVEVDPKAKEDINSKKR